MSSNILKFGIGSFFAAAGYFHIRDLRTSQLWEKIKADSREPERIKDKDCILLFRSAADHNGALANRERTLFTSLAEEGKVIPIVQDVSYAEDITKTINILRNQKNRIHSIFICAHGNPNGLKLSEPPNNDPFKMARDAFFHWISFPYKGNVVHAAESRIDLLKSREIAKEQVAALASCINQLETSPPVSLISCSAADDCASQGGNSIAKKLSSNLKRSSVFATPKQTSFLEYSIEMRLVKTKNGICNIPYSAKFFDGAKDITKVFIKTQESSYSIREKLSSIQAAVTSLLKRIYDFVLSILFLPTKNLSQISSPISSLLGIESDPNRVYTPTILNNSE